MTTEEDLQKKFAHLAELEKELEHYRALLKIEKQKAAKRRAGRKFVGTKLDEDYFEICRQRIEDIK